MSISERRVIGTLYCSIALVQTESSYFVQCTINVSKLRWNKYLHSHMPFCVAEAESPQKTECS